MSCEEFYSTKKDEESQIVINRGRRSESRVTFNSNGTKTVSELNNIIGCNNIEEPKKYISATRHHPLSIWQLYCYLITFWAPPLLLKICGMPTKKRQMAWREKIALISIICYLGVLISFLTFGFTNTVCNYSRLRLLNTQITDSYIVINGKAYDYQINYNRAEYINVVNGTVSGPKEGAGTDGSFLFQNVNGNCHNLISPRVNSTIPRDEENNLAWYFPCNIFAIDGSTNSTTQFTDIENCHLSDIKRKEFYAIDSRADIYYTWEQVKNDSRRLVVFDGNVLDLDLLNWIIVDELEYPYFFKELRELNLQGYDITAIMNTNYEKQIGRCLTEIIKVGEIESQTVGCIASNVVLYTSLLFILSVVIVKFVIACYFHWTIAKRQGASQMDNKSMSEHTNAIEDWSKNIETQAPLKSFERNNKLKDKFSTGFLFEETMQNLKKRDSLFESSFDYSFQNIPTDLSSGMTTMTIQKNNVFRKPGNCRNSSSKHKEQTLNPIHINKDVIEQPEVGFQPFNFPLIHTICFVTCYSEDEQGLRTTLDSLATTDYPNSHKLIMVVCDGLIKGSGNERTTPDIVLDMVDNFITPPSAVAAYSYIAVASGTKRHNMAKVYAGYYKYDDETIPVENRQTIPMVVIVKCGTIEEQVSTKPGNRGKRDSQVILMTFLQKITFNERMTELEFEILENIWKLTGLMADLYEAVLMVDADTKVFPDSLTHMVAELVRDPQIMGLCGETKIANKAESWVSAIQVFEYYISHHQIKAFESFFGTVTCLPGCFSIYRIKSPKGNDGLWVPILINPDIIELYSDNDVSTLHKKNLLLLGEDRFLSSLMLKTFPKRKQIFVPKAACKTIVPAQFKVLLSQRRRWINSTVHNLFELVLVRGLCGTFCFSMQFVIIIELIGTLILPLAICFTIYVIFFAIFSNPTPVVTLILLALILGLPGLLVVVTITRLSYMIWMFIYILALPIWNFILPSYAYWKFDDFSWGDTRKIAGESLKRACNDIDGDFEHSKIKMKTWRQFEMERL